MYRPAIDKLRAGLIPLGFLLSNRLDVRIDSVKTLEQKGGRYGMSDTETPNVTMRVRIGESEIEVTGPSDFVEKKISEFIEQQKQSMVVVGEREEDKVTSIGPTSVGGKTMSVAQFFNQVSPKTDVDRGLAAAYYLEKLENCDKFTTAEIRDTIRQAKEKPPTNPSDVIARNIKKGFMMPAGDKDGKPAYVLTNDGEEAIEATLLEE